MKMLKKGEILKSIPVSRFSRSKEPTRVYRLGSIRKTTYDLVELSPNIYYPPHWHHKAQGYLLFVTGEGKLILENKEISYKQGDYFYIGKKVKHGFKPKKHSLILSLQTSPVKDLQSGKEDIEF